MRYYGMDLDDPESGSFRSPLPHEDGYWAISPADVTMQVLAEMEISTRGWYSQEDLRGLMMYDDEMGIIIRLGDEYLRSKISDLFLDDRVIASAPSHIDAVLSRVHFGIWRKREDLEAARGAATRRAAYSAKPSSSASMGVVSSGEHALVERTVDPVNARALMIKGESGVGPWSRMLSGLTTLERETALRAARASGYLPPGHVIRSWGSAHHEGVVLLRRARVLVC